MCLDTLGKSESVDEVTYCRNVWGIDRDGTTRWKIEPAETIRGEHKPYTSIWKEKGELWAYNWNGMGYQIDKSDGSISDSRFMK